MRRLLLSLLVLAGCPRETTTSPPPVPSQTAPEPSLAQAEAHERGDGVARDYARAAGVYADLCDDGAGDVQACRRLIRAIGLARGVDHDLARLTKLANTICQKHGDILGCSIVVFLAVRTRQTADPAIVEKVTAARTCDAGHLDVCEAGLDLFGGIGDQSGAREWEEQKFNASACAVGVIDSCVALVQQITMCASSSHFAECVADEEQEWRSNDERDRLDALERLRGACKRGDASACAALPGQEIPYEQLCAAHDYGACAALGCLGDTKAAALAEAHGGEANCYYLEQLANDRAMEAEAEAARTP